MLDIRKINKYFNRHKKNELHVINNISLNINDNGLVALLGPSGCGKTTLLNTIGGLDKVKNGRIFIDGENITSKWSYKIDKIRNLKVGYIFQDYKLIDNLSVYDNISLVLKMIGIKDKREIKTRVEYVLDCVGMLRYKKRPAAMLSGGERQRVGIARAIVKNPDIILADEPTGNLDSKNSLEVMNIIKAISKDRLVLLVTHEKDLARFYADRIIEVQDGSIINDYQNDHNLELDYQIDNRFYLKDFDNHTIINKDNCKMNIYRNDNSIVNLDIVVRNGNIYIKGNNETNIDVIDSESSIEFIDDHYKNIVRKDIDKYKFNFKDIINNDVKLKYSSVLNPISLLINGFKKVFNYSFLKKILLAGFFLAGMFIMYSVSSIAANLQVNDEDFVSVNKEYLSVALNKVSVSDYLEYEKREDINYILPGDSIVNFNILYDDYYQTSNISDILSGSLASVSLIKDKELLYGRYPDSKYEIVVDKFSIENMFKENLALMAGVTKISDMLDKEVTINNMPSFKIVGIVDLGSPSIYVDYELFIDIIANGSDSNSDRYSDTGDSQLVNYDLYKDKVVLKEGVIPSGDYEVIVNINNKELMPLKKEIEDKVNGKKLKVVGYYTSKYNYSYMFSNSNTIKYSVIESSKGMTINSNDKDKTINDFREMKLNINDSYTMSRDSYIKSRQEYVRNTLLVSGVMLIISLVEIFLMIRSSFLSRIKEIGIYRAIGVKKSDIYKMFMGEIVAISTLASIPGLIIMAYCLKVISSIKYLSSYFMVNIGIVVMAIVFVYLFNLIVGLLPVFNTIRKTPAEILARHDID